MLAKIFIGVYLKSTLRFSYGQEKDMKTLQQLLDTKKYKEVISIAPHRPVFDALVVLAEYKIGALLVLEGEKLVGIFSERDYAREVMLKGRSSKTTQISDVMTHNVICGKPDDTVEQALTLLTSKNFRHLPVVENDKVLGILSLGDLAKETIDYQQRLIKKLESYINS
jgi:CBS domain-containing protein